MTLLRKAALNFPPIRRLVEGRDRLLDVLANRERELVALREQLAESEAAAAADIRERELAARLGQKAQSDAAAAAIRHKELDAFQEQMVDMRAIISQYQDLLELNNIPPAPPAHLQRRVVGGVSPNFIKSAQRSIAEFEDALRLNGAELETMRSILDFGVGCGRVSRRIAEMMPGVEVVGADIDDEAIGWLTTNYAPDRGSFVTLPHLPPSSLPAEKFDFVYSISVFTHLDEEMQFAWLAELRRVTKPGGFLILTVHGENYVRLFPAEVQERTWKEGIYYNQNAGPTEGLPDFYKNTYHTRAYIEREWAKFFDILSYQPLGNENHQDLIVCRKRLEPMAI